MSVRVLCSGGQTLKRTPSSGDSIPSSMETVPTDFVDGYSSEEELDVWGRLFPIGPSFTAVDLVKEEYVFGRGDQCDYQFNSPAMKRHPCFQAYSKNHFKIIKEQTSTGTHVFLTDLSSNGTFINGEKIGKNCKQVLNNNDEIALSMEKNKAFVFMDSSANDESHLPEELREKYTLSKLLGRGACGEVKLAFAKGSCQKYAVKIIQKKKFSVGGRTETNMSNQVMNEVKILKALKHPCIINIEDVIDCPDTLYIVLELVEGGELFDRVVSLGSFEEPVAKMLFYQMVSGVKYLHDQGIAHRDLKPENILLKSETEDTVIKVTDFGLSKFVDGNSMMKTFCGTPNYLAPEILVTAGNAEYTNAVDVWSLGVILFICLVGYPPFSDERKDIPDLSKQIIGGHYEFLPEFWKDKSNDAKDLIRQMLTVDPKKRITLADALEHKWLKDEEMRKTAHALMYPESGDMLPPSTIPKKRKADSAENCEETKRQSLEGAKS